MQASSTALVSSFAAADKAFAARYRILVDKWRDQLNNGEFLVVSLQLILTS